MKIWRMRVACWISKTVNTHSEYVIIIPFPLQQWLHERASMSCFTYIACLVVWSFITEVFGLIPLTDFWLNHSLKNERGKTTALYPVFSLVPVMCSLVRSSCYIMRTHVIAHLYIKHVWNCLKPLRWISNYNDSFIFSALQQLMKLRDSSLGIMTIRRAGRPRDRRSFPAGAKDLSPQRLKRLRKGVSLTLLFKGYRVGFLSGVKRPRREDNHSLPSSTHVKNICYILHSHTSLHGVNRENSHFSMAASI